MRHLKVFGLVCYKHVLDKVRKNLDDKSETLILVGYHPTGAYRLYDPKKKRIVMSRDVIVDESAIFNWENVDANQINQTDDVVITWLGENKIEETKMTTHNEGVDTKRSQRACFSSSRLANYEVFNDYNITDTREIVHYALLAGAETLTWEQAIKIKE